jgi:hypothetical protein
VVHVLVSKAFMLQIAPLVYVTMVVHVLVSKAFMLQIAPLVYVTMVVHVVVSKAFMLQIAPKKLSINRLKGDIPSSFIITANLNACIINQSCTYLYYM